VRPLLFLAGVFALGTVGYRALEGSGWWDSFYMTAITLTTVGYREVFPLSRAGEVFTVVLLVMGLGVLLLAATEIGRSVVEGELRQAFGQMRRSRMIERFAKHEIVCGWGRMGRAVVEELQRGGHRVVVVERSPEKIRQIEEAGVPVVAGDATQESVLEAAGVRRARGLVACLDDDAHNVYTVLTARSLNPELVIVARSGEEGAVDRLRRAGANRVVNTYQIGGIRLAHLLVKPTVVDFLEFSLSPADREGLQLEELLLTASSSLVGRSLAEADLRRRWGVGVVAVWRGQQLFPNPEAGLRLEPGDRLVVLGTHKALTSFESGAAGEAAS
jgi:voltage-gated potassium channel